MSTFGSRALHLLGLFVTLSLLATGCAVTAGSTFSSVVAAEESASDDENDDDERDPPEDDRPPLRVLSDPSGAAVSLDGRLRGATPLDVDDIEPGTYLVRVEKDGYYGVRRWVEVPRNGSVILEVDLEPITGYLDVDVSPSHAEVFVDGNRITDFFAELPIGRYEVRVRLFGYRSRSQTVRIREREVARVAFDLEPAPFEITSLSAWRARFNPANPGLVGTTLVSYRVSAPGSAQLSIVGPEGEIVRSVPQGPFSTWEQEHRWDGTDDRGRPVDDGSYVVRVEGTGNDGRIDSAETVVEIDRSIVVRYRSIWGPTPGLLFVPTRSALPSGQVQAAMQVAGIVSPVTDRIAYRFPGRLGVRVGLGGGVEISTYGGFVAHSDPIDDRFSGGGSIAWDGLSVGLGRVSLGAGLAAGGSAQTASPDGRIASPDTQTSYPGFYVSLPISIGTGSLDFLLAPEYRLTPAPVAYGDGPLPANRWGSIAYLRTGVVADLSTVSIGLSGAVRSERFSEGFAVDLPVQIGAEAHWIVPGSSVALSFFVASEIESASDFYLMSGIGVGGLF
ncbi:MAG: PEGA domain-containing protein [Spirochaetota bacterium]